MNGAHYMIQCSECGDIIEQCRCFGPKELKFAVCEKCKKQMEAHVIPIQ